MVGQASSLSIWDDRQDAGPTSNHRNLGDCFASLAMTARVFPDTPFKNFQMMVAHSARLHGSDVRRGFETRAVHSVVLLFGRWGNLGQSQNTYEACKSKLLNHEYGDSWQGTSTHYFTLR
jgi:hypothetical protein